jgi:hypothetical protein
MAVLLALIICPILFATTFLIVTSFFIYKLIKSQHVEYSGNTIIRTINVTPFEVTCCMGCIWNTCLDKTTNRMALSTFIIWYIVNIFIEIVLTVLIFLLFYYGTRIYV